MAPNRAAAEQYPIAVPLTLVGYTSGVYTNTAWNTPVAKARMKNRKKVMTFLQGKEVGESVCTAKRILHKLAPVHQSNLLVQSTSPV